MTRFFSAPLGLVAGLLLTATALVAQVPINQRAAGPAAGKLQLRAFPVGADGRRPAATAALAAVREALALRPADELRLLRTEADALGGQHLRYQQYYRGVKVEHGVVTAHARHGALETVSGDWTLPAAGFGVQPVITEALARKQALAAVGARQYMWEDAAEEAALKRQTGNPAATYRPTGELVIVEDFRQPATGAQRRPVVLAWKFNVYARQPISRALLYVDARTGAVVLRDAVIKHLNAPGTFATRYSGTKTSMADQFGGGFRLRETTRGKGVTTLNCERGTSFAAAVDFVDNDNNWTAAEYNNFNFDNAALDAHLGAQATQDYWVSQHGRDSYDDRGTVLLSYVHFDMGFENAFWDGTAMVYGDGASFFRPLTAVDVCAHEVGHAVCETTANLVYQDESGALNEGFSDIWGACVEHHFDPTKQFWLIGEDITRQSVSLRSMSNPNAQGQPDTYLGDFWDPNQEVHTNSGVFNFWFYLLSEGGFGTNDNGTTYNVAGINIVKASQIAYRAERLYLTPNATYADARQTTLQAAVDLFGLGSAEVVATAQAWRAVGLDAAAPRLTTLTPTSGPIGTVVTLTGANLGTTFRVTFNGVPATLATMTSATQLTVVVPPGATTGAVVVTTTTGTATSAGVFTVTGNPAAAPSILSFTPAAGAPQGTTVTLTGTNFTGTTAVLFNGVPAVFTVVSATQITATVPATATSGLLTVTTANGTATAPAPFLVLPAITALTPAVGVVGTTVEITGTSLADALTVRFNGTYATFTAVSPTRLTATVPPGATTGFVVVRTPSGTATSPVPFVVTPSLGLFNFDPAQGAPLTTIVTIRGMGFTGTTAVRFNTTAATTFRVASDTELWATVPAGATTGRISVTTPLGTVTSTGIFTVLIPGGPVIDSFTPVLGPVGTTVTLNGRGLANATAVTFNGTPAVVTFSTPTMIMTTVPVGATTGQITVTTAIGTAATATPFRVTVPPANDRCSAPNLPVLTCGGPALLGTTLGAGLTDDPTGFCGTSIDGPGVFYRLIGTGGFTTVQTCGTVTDYDSKLHIFSGTCTNLTCVDGNDDACNGTSSAISFPTTAGTQYLIFVSGWNRELGDFSIEALCTAPPPAPTITTLSPTSGPVGTTVTISGTNLATVTDVTFNGTTAAILSTTPTTVTATVLVGSTTGPVTVTTSGGTATSVGDFIVTASAPTVVSFTPLAGPVGATVTLTGTNLTGTTAVLFGAVPATTFSVNPAGTRLTITVPPDALFAPISVTTPGGTRQSTNSFCTQYLATASGAESCGTNRMILSASGAPASADRYAWYTTATGGTPIAGATGASFTTPPLSVTTTYYVAVSPAGACAGPRVPVLATVTAVPQAIVTASGPTTLCAGDSVLLTATGGDTYRWSTGATTAAIRVSTGGTYTVTAATGGGLCTAISAPVTVTVVPRPAPPTIIATPQPTGLVVLSSSAPTGNQWYFNGALIPGATGATYTVSTSAQSGQYTVVTTANGCASAASAALPVVVTGTAAEALAARWQLWPNPATHEIRSAGLPSGTTLTLLDATGRTIRVATADAAGAAALEVGTVARGVYVVRLTGGATRRVVLE